jgi:hypothetical protein
VRTVVALALVACVVGLAGCGGGSDRGAAPRATSPAGGKAERPCRKRTRATERAEARLAGDVGAIRRAAALPTRDRFRGNPAINRAIDRFLLDEGSLPLDNFTRNRYINLAVGSATPVCQQCFQALEAARPITQASLSQPGALPCPGRKD